MFLDKVMLNRRLRIRGLFLRLFGFLPLIGCASFARNRLPVFPSFVLLLVFLSLSLYRIFSFAFSIYYKRRGGGGEGEGRQEGREGSERGREREVIECMEGRRDGE